MDYIILHREKNGEYKPLTFKDNVIVIYGDKEEAEKDMHDCDVLFEIKEQGKVAESQTQSAYKPKYRIGDSVYKLLGGTIHKLIVQQIKIHIGERLVIYEYDVEDEKTHFPTSSYEDELFATPDELCKHLLENLK